MNLPRIGDARPLALASEPSGPEVHREARGDVRREGTSAGGEQHRARRERGLPVDRSAPEVTPFGGRRDGELGGAQTGLSRSPGATLPDDVTQDGSAAAAGLPRLPGRPPLPLPDAALSERFHKALRRDDDSPEPLPSPMSLFSALPPPAPPVALATIEPPPPPPALWQQIDRLLVADGSESRESRRQVRLTLADRELHGTEVEVGEAGGELRVAFLCADIATRRRLAHHAPTMAAQLAERLDRAVLVAVGSPDRHDPERTECRQGAPA